MTCPHHVGKREKRGHERVFGTDWQNYERSVCLGNANRLALASVDAVAGPPASASLGAVSASEVVRL